MKKFIFFLVNIATITILLAVTLDFLYTSIYLQSNNRRKIGYIYNSNPKTIDVIILGSSRANNHFVTPLFAEKGLTAFNFGMQGARLFESDLVLKILLEKKYIIKNVIIEVDLNLRSDFNSYSESNVLKFMPYLYSSENIRNQFKNLSDYNFEYYIPFYRYMKYDTSLGFREVFFSAINKKSKELDNGGYNALYNSDEKRPLDLSVFSPAKNKYYEEIRHLCKQNNINLIAIMTPVCKNTKGMNYFVKVNKVYPEINNYANVIQDDKCFYSCGHMNDIGARIFTTRVLKDFFNK
ncbi:hypothetical protein [Flavobacterium sp. SLB02]|uniref:hypothetical protein n=1 Tax=Flavobacterium sp. SLB02 TaxID=2665645 RepID=UPI0012AA1BB1|nr:hypothetical protein [Flavobacterium sp. SLB02]QGK76889.1 hypothetical protein GIY83_23290 [Flavobacterium sp. SLB02]